MRTVGTERVTARTNTMSRSATSGSNAWGLATRRRRSQVGVLRIRFRQLTTLSRVRGRTRSPLRPALSCLHLERALRLVSIVRRATFPNGNSDTNDRSRRIAQTVAKAELESDGRCSCRRAGHRRSVIGRSGACHALAPKISASRRRIHPHVPRRRGPDRTDSAPSARMNPNPGRPSCRGECRAPGGPPRTG